MTTFINSEAQKYKKTFVNAAPLLTSRGTWVSFLFSLKSKDKNEKFGEVIFLCGCDIDIKSVVILF